MFDAHEVSVLSTTASCVVLVNRILPKNWVRGMIHRQPVVAMSCFLGVVGVAMPVVVIPLRRMFQLPTNQYDATHHNCTMPKYSY